MVFFFIWQRMIDRLMENYFLLIKGTYEIYYPCGFAFVLIYDNSDISCLQTLTKCQTQYFQVYKFTCDFMKI